MRFTGPENGSVAVGIVQMFVDPGARGQGRVGKLPGRKHDLAIFPVDGVAVVVHVHKFVIGADFLQLAVGGEEGRMVPEADILDGQVIAPQVFPGQAFLRRKFPVFAWSSADRPCRVYLMFLFEEGLLQDDFVGHDLESLHQRRINSRPHDQHDQESRHSHSRNPPVFAENQRKNGKAAKNGDSHQ